MSCELCVMGFSIGAAHRNICRKVMKITFFEVQRTMILNNISVRCTSENVKNLNATNISRLCRFYANNFIFNCLGMF